MYGYSTTDTSLFGTERVKQTVARQSGENGKQACKEAPEEKKKRRKNEKKGRRFVDVYETLENIRLSVRRVDPRVC